MAGVDIIDYMTVITVTSNPMSLCEYAQVMKELNELCTRHNITITFPQQRDVCKNEASLVSIEQLKAMPVLLFMKDGK
jgi:hypothetical protein